MVKRHPSQRPSRQQHFRQKIIMDLKRIIQTSLRISPHIKQSERILMGPFQTDKAPGLI